MKATLLRAGGLLLSAAVLALCGSAVDIRGAEPAKRDASAGADLGCGLFIHWALLTFTGGTYEGDKTKDYGQIPPERFAPTGMDARQWARAAKDSGMTFVLLIAKHEDGFCFWPTKTSEYSVAHSPYQADLLKESIAACRAEGLLPGLYYSLVDAHNEGTFRMRGPVGPPFFNLVKKQIAELLTRYPDTRILLLDIVSKLSEAQFDELRDIVKRCSPQCAILGDRQAPWGQNFGYDTVLKNWFWQTNATLTPTAKLLDNYRKTREKGWPFLLAAGPDPDGRIPSNQIAALMEFKARKTPPSAATRLNPTERLKQLKDLYNQGLISKEDFDQKVKEVLDSL